MCPVHKFKCDGGPVFGHTAAQGDELEWKRRKQRRDRKIGSNCAVMRIYIHGGSDPLCAQLNPGRGVCGSASEARHHRGFLRWFQWILDHHGTKITSSALLMELTGNLLMCSLGQIPSLPFCSHSCPFQLSALLLFPRLGMSACRGREARDTLACHRVGWNSPDSERTSTDISHSSHNQWNNKKTQSCRCLMFYHFFTSCEATYTLGILIRNSKCYEKRQKKEKKKGLWLLGDVLLPLYLLSSWDLCSPLSLRGRSQPQLNGIGKTLMLEESHSQERDKKARKGTASWFCYSSSPPF